jgi:hypothetical protein
MGLGGITIRSCIGAAIFATYVHAQCTMGLDRPNNDFENMPLALPYNDSFPCSLMCSADPACQAYVFVPSCAGTGSAPVCYLKATVPATVPRDCRCSALVNRSTPVTPQQDTVVHVLSSGTTLLSPAWIQVGMGSRGIVWINASDPAAAQQAALLGTTAGRYVWVDVDTWSVAVDEQLFNSSSLPTPTVSSVSDTAITYSYSTQGYAINVTYSVLPGTYFVSKQISILPAASASLNVISVSPFDTLRLATNSPLAQSIAVSGAMGGYGTMLRFVDGSGIFASAQNPFLYPFAVPAPPVFSHPYTNGTYIHVGYHPSMIWNVTTAAFPQPAAFVADAAILSVFSLTPFCIPPGSLGNSIAEPVAAFNERLGKVTLQQLDTDMKVEVVDFMPMAPTCASNPGWLNTAERDAFRDAAQALYMNPPEKSVKVHIPWTENDYQIDIINSTLFAQYQRIFARLQQLGVTHNLYAACDSEVSTRANNTDSWGWEEVLWLNEGQHIRENEWLPGRDPLAPTTQQLIAAAAASDIKLMPYIYPILAFSENPDWLFPSGGGMAAKLDSRDLQDFLIATILALSNATGASGAGFDYTFFENNNATQYAQWFGWRRVLITLRQTLGSTENFVVDNRQLNHQWGPWMWIAGSYAEPMQTDEGPYSWPAYLLDPHTDRQSANRNRQVNYVYAQQMFCPMYAMPGFINHQSDRFYDGQIVFSQLNVRDYDFYGATYSIVSSIAVGGMNNVVCDIPARDEAEFNAFPTSGPTTENSIDFYQRWFFFADVNRDYLAVTKPLPYPPGPGVVDGSFAILNNGGFVFLFNPNSRSLSSPVLTVDASIGIYCDASQSFAFIEVWPVGGRLAGVVQCGNNFTVQMEGRAALVLNVTSASMDPSVAYVSGPASRATTTVIRDTNRNCVVIKGLEYAQLLGSPTVLHLPKEWLGDSTLACVSFNGVIVKLDAATQQQASSPSAGHISLEFALATANATFVHSQPVQGMGYNATFAGGQLTGVVNVPAAVFAQLQARNASYAIDWTTDDDAIAWLNPSRLLLYVDVQFAVGPGATIPATLNGNDIPVLPVWSCRSLQSAMCFSGYWIDLTAAGVEPDVEYTLQLTLPTMPAGAFQGVYYDNVDTIYSSELIAAELK